MSAQIFAFQPNVAADREIARAPEPNGPPQEALPEREWGLTAGQVVAVVLAIVAACEVFGLLF